jgi:hypothetical protein
MPDRAGERPGHSREIVMLFAYEIAFRKDAADRRVTVSFDLDPAGFEARHVEAMKDKFLWEALLLVVRRSPGREPGAVRALHRLSPTTAQLKAAGLAAEPSDLTGWALREFGDVDDEVPCHG